MKIVIDEICREPLNTSADKVYPLGWIGDVDDGLAEKWIAEGKARAVGEPVETGLTADETLVLKSVAGEIIANLNAQHPDQTPEQVPPVVPGANEPTDQPELTRTVDAGELAALNINELRALAKDGGVQGAHQMSKAALVEALLALQAA